MAAPLNLVCHAADILSDLGRWGIFRDARKQVAEEYPVTDYYLASLAHQKQGPKYVIIGNKAIYRRTDLESWLSNLTIHPKEKGPFLADPDAYEHIEIPPLPSVPRRGRRTKAAEVKERRARKKKLDS